MAIKIYDRYTPRAIPADANYPQGSIKNESTPGANDGTPLEKDWGNDISGFHQKLLLEGGVTPSGNPDTVLASDYYDSLQNVLMRSGGKPFATVAALKADTTVKVGDFVTIESYTATNNSGVMFGKIVAGGTGTDDGLNYIDLAGSGLQFKQNLPSVVNVKTGGVYGDGTTLDNANLNRVLASGHKSFVADSDDIFLTDGQIDIPEGVTFDLNGATIKADPALSNTGNIVSIKAANVIVKNGTVDGNRANLLNAFPAGGTGCGVFVGDGGDNVIVYNMTTHSCPTNGQLAVSLLGSIDTVTFEKYHAYNNGYTGVGGESQVNGSPLQNLSFINGKTHNNKLGGDVRIQGCTNCVIIGHKGDGGDHGALVIGPGEAFNDCNVKISDSYFKNNNAGLSTADIDAKVGGSGPYAGSIADLEVRLNNVTFIGSGSGSGLVTRNESKVYGSIVRSSNHNNNGFFLSDSDVKIDKFISTDSAGQSAVLSTTVDLTNAVFERWGATTNAVQFNAGSTDSVVTGHFGARAGETGKDGVNQTGSPSGITLDIKSFTGSGLSKGLISGVILKTWDIKNELTNNLLSLEDGIDDPIAEAGKAKMYIDASDGNLKIIFGDGVVKTIVVDV